MGGAAGSLLRWGLGHVLPSGSVWHWSTLTVNVVGALLLGLLLEALTRPGGSSPAVRTRHGCCWAPGCWGASPPTPPSPRSCG
ncbi:CrcB family protein, partial [Catenulispora sp. NF23]|nr:CrcB family protein [Catenulispora pinistramenti]